MIISGMFAKAISRRSTGLLAGLTMILGVSGLALMPVHASEMQLALSEIQREELPVPPAADPAPQTAPAPAAPAPATPAAPAAPAENNAAPAQEAPADGEQAKPDSADPGRPHVAEENTPPPPVEYDLTKLPFPVQKMRQMIIDAAKSGSLDALRPLIGTGEAATTLSLGDPEGDPIDYMRGLAGDEAGLEILAIIVDLLEAGYVHLDAGTPNELYVWPYFFAYPLEKLDPKQMVELYQIVTAGDVEDMKSYGAYTFYRLGITPAGQWRFFVAGD